jgi:hypothetical protein
MKGRRLKNAAVWVCIIVVFVSAYLTLVSMAGWLVAAKNTPSGPQRTFEVRLTAVGACGFPVLAVAALWCAWYFGRTPVKVAWRCEDCGYDLRGCADGVCPECGKGRQCDRCGYERKGRTVCPLCGDGE